MPYSASSSAQMKETVMLSRYRKQGFLSGKRSAFTLIELLVVNAIIAILAAILFREGT